MIFRVFSDFGSQSLLKIVGLALIMNVYFTEGQGITECFYALGSCACFSNLGIIDLKPASKSSPYQFVNVQNLDVFYWDPCKDFTFGVTTAESIQQTISGLTMDIGVHRSYFTDALNGYARFNMASGDKSRETYVQCNCGPGDIFAFVKEDPALVYNFIFTSNACCPITVPANSTTST